MSDETACDIFTILTGILAEPVNQEELHAKVVVVTVCDGICETDRHEFEIATSEGQRYRVVLEKTTDNGN